jgi:pyrimidine operon attenuation protein/uracil phosphoribosyltransferase
MQKRLLLNSTNFDITIRRLCYQLIENHDDFSNSALIGIQPRGVFVASRIHHHLSQILKSESILLGQLDITFYRDDFRRRELNAPCETNIGFEVENRNVILIDDVLYTGRTIRAGMDALLDLGRPQKVELLTLIDRRYSRHLPIAPDYTGLQVDSISSEKVKVQWKESEGEDSVWLI